MNSNNGMSGLVPPFFARWDKGLRWCDVFQKKDPFFSVPQSGWGTCWKAGKKTNITFSATESVRMLEISIVEPPADG